MTEIKLKNHPYAKCKVEVTPTQIAFTSYCTVVIVANLTTREIECTGTYSATTRRQISWFLREYFPNVNYSDIKRIAGTTRTIRF